MSHGLISYQNGLQQDTTHTISLNYQFMEPTSEGRKQSA